MACMNVNVVTVQLGVRFFLAAQDQLADVHEACVRARSEAQGEPCPYESADFNVFAGEIVQRMADMELFFSGEKALANAAAVDGKDTACEQAVAPG